MYAKLKNQRSYISPELRDGKDLAYPVIAIENRIYFIDCTGQFISEDPEDLEIIGDELDFQMYVRWIDRRKRVSVWPVELKHFDMDEYIDNPIKGNLSVQLICDFYDQYLAHSPLYQAIKKNFHLNNHLGNIGGHEQGYWLLFRKNSLANPFYEGYDPDTGKTWVLYDKIFKESVQREWVEKNCIPSGALCGYSDQELNDFEAKYQLVLPDCFRLFLSLYGHGVPEYGVRDYAEIVDDLQHRLQIALKEIHFENPENFFAISVQSKSRRPLNYHYLDIYFIEKPSESLEDSPLFVLTPRGVKKKEAMESGFMFVFKNLNSQKTKMPSYVQDFHESVQSLWIRKNNIPAEVIRGYSAQDLTEFEAKYQLILPDCFRLFLSSYGHGSPDYGIKDYASIVDNLQDCLQTALKEINFENTENYFAVSMQGQEKPEIFFIEKSYQAQEDCSVFVLKEDQVMQEKNMRFSLSILVSNLYDWDRPWGPDDTLSKSDEIP